MTTKYKVIAGFLLMLLLLASVSLIAYRGFGSASDRFGEYDRLSKFNVNLSDIESSIYKSAYEVNRAIVTNDFTLMDTGGEAIKRAIALVDDCLTLVHLPERKQILEKMRGSLEKYNGLIGDVKNGYMAALSEYGDKISPSFQSMTAAFDRMVQQKDALVYEFHGLPAPEKSGDLAFGASIVYPGKIGDDEQYLR